MKICHLLATQMDLEINIVSEVKSDGERQISYDIINMWNLKKNDRNEFIYKISVGTVTGVCFLYLLFGYQEGKSSGRDKVGDWY